MIGNNSCVAPKIALTRTKSVTTNSLYTIISHGWHDFHLGLKLFTWLITFSNKSVGSLLTWGNVATRASDDGHGLGALPIGINHLG